MVLSYYYASLKLFYRRTQPPKGLETPKAVASFLSVNSLTPKKSMVDCVVRRDGSSFSLKFYHLPTKSNAVSLGVSRSNTIGIIYRDVICHKAVKNRVKLKEGK